MRRTIVILLLFLAGCSAEQMIERMSTPEERTMALEAAKALAAGDYQTLDRMIDPPLRDELTPESLAKIKPMVPRGEMALKTMAMRSTTVDGVTTTLKSFNYEVGSGDRWAIVQITLRVAPPRETVFAGYRVWPVDHAPSGFSFARAGPAHYFWLFAMALAVGLSLMGFVQVLRTRGLKLKWLWAIGCLFSFVTFTLAWETGMMGVAPISFLVLGAAYFQLDLQGGPLLQFAIPVVAILFLIRKASGAFDPDPEAEAEIFD
ncbi:hypothetical protein OF829_18595 [Sphingomonas sp. LB-2]|uniref:hypothetical protein n=1 Tax=Sphingomonas caeni TaxID=2984949 RepID=UPI002230AD88|nr:hypothetical protein [Sphingomonas caeni]MCW3849252.1 hypothetical protein [Sphingomonas caeni]